MPHTWQVCCGTSEVQPTSSRRLYTGRVSALLLRVAAWAAGTTHQGAACATLQVLRRAAHAAAGGGGTGQPQEHWAAITGVRRCSR